MFVCTSCMFLKSTLQFIRQKNSFIFSIPRECFTFKCDFLFLFWGLNWEAFPLTWTLLLKLYSRKYCCVNGRQSFVKEVLDQEWKSAIVTKHLKLTQYCWPHTCWPWRFVFKEILVSVFFAKSIVFFFDRSLPFVQEKTGIPFISLCLHF